MESNANLALLQGNVLCTPVFSHESHGKSFLRFLIEVPRLSGTVDCLPVIAESGLLPVSGILPGCTLEITGQVRSHNIRQCGKRHLLVFVFAQSVTIGQGSGVNEITLEGILCRDPNYRRTPLGREICDLMLAVPRGFQRSDYLPCILWGRTAKNLCQLHTGDRILVRGRLQSRVYSKQTENGCQEKTAYEISALSAEQILDCPENEQG